MEIGKDMGLQGMIQGSLTCVLHYGNKLELGMVKCGVTL